MADPDLERRRLEASVALLRLPLTTSEKGALLAAVDLAVETTGSRIGYLHYLNDDQVTIELSTWSSHTRDFCTATHDRHYPLDSAGIWADTARTRSPHVHNDYPTATGRRGLPEGHSALTRHLGVAAVDRTGQVRLLLGVGNKPTDYDDDDVATAQAMVDEAWVVLDRLREHHRAARALSLLRGRQASARLSTWEWDPDDGQLTWDDEAGAVLGLVNGTRPGTDWAWLFDRVDATSRLRLERGLAPGRDGVPLDLDVRVRADDGAEIPVRLQGEWTARPQGLGRVLRGTAMDVSLQEEVARARFRDTHDALTGLPNRSWLLDELAGLLSDERRALAVHHVHLSEFARLTADRGTLVADDLLRTCADRLTSVARGRAVAARLGDADFVLVQSGAGDPAAASALAERIVDVLDRPVDLGDGQVAVGPVVGVALRAVDAGDARSLLLRADRACRDAAGAGRRVAVAVADQPLTGP